MSKKSSLKKSTILKSTILKSTILKSTIDKEGPQISKKLVRKKKYPNYYQNYPFIPPEVEMESEISMMIIHIREEIFEKAIERAYNNFLEAQSIPLAVQCLKEALRKIVNWMYFPKEEQNLELGWTEMPEPEHGTVDNFCCGVVANSKEGFKADIEELPRVDEIDRTLGSIESIPYSLPEEIVTVKKRKKLERVKQKPDQIIPLKKDSPVQSISGSRRTKSINSKSLGGENRAGGGVKHKYVRQLANYIHPRVFAPNTALRLEKKRTEDNFGVSIAMKMKQ